MRRTAILLTLLLSGCGTITSFVEQPPIHTGPYSGFRWGKRLMDRTSSMEAALRWNEADPIYGEEDRHGAMVIIGVDMAVSTFLDTLLLPWTLTKTRPELRSE